MIPEQNFDPRTIPDTALSNFRRLALKQVAEDAPVFGEWLRSWCETEQYWRATDPKNRPEKHFIALPPVCAWTDRELGAAVRAAAVLSYRTLPVEIGVFVDRIVLAISEEAADRLIKHND
ncbi:MAG: hypothetical protein JW959_07045 [Pirellulales bacterium]|nr:hypothetical protein [Pirellulales bacterium]